jgi:hypothetical protein
LNGTLKHIAQIDVESLLGSLNLRGVLSNTVNKCPDPVLVSSHALH